MRPWWERRCGCFPNTGGNSFAAHRVRSVRGTAPRITWPWTWSSGTGDPCSSGTTSSRRRTTRPSSTAASGGVGGPHPAAPPSHTGKGVGPLVVLLGGPENLLVADFILPHPDNSVFLFFLD